MLFTTEWLSRIFTEYNGIAQEKQTIKEVITDSRTMMTDALFIPIVGENFDGHDFIDQAIKNGATAILWNRKRGPAESIPADILVFYVDDTTTALQELAANYRNEIDPIVVGITGSNGKTTTKDLVAAMAGAVYRTHYTDGNFNNHIGLPLTILSMKRDTEVLVLEMGMSDFGEIDLLSRLARPDYAIITNIGESHIEYLESREGITKAKLEITNGLKDNGWIIFDGDEKLLKPVHGWKNSITCGFHPSNDAVINHVEVGYHETSFQMSGTAYTVPLLGKHHALNATFAIKLGEKLGIDPEKRKQALRSLKQTGMRFEMIQGNNGVSIINDAYNASPTSMKAAINVVKQMEGFSAKVLILGDVLELGAHSEVMHRSVAEEVEEPITALFTFGDEAKYISDAVRENIPSIICRYFDSKEDLVEALQPYMKKDALFLFKASRGLKFESIIKEIIHP
ncbi:UDP-N-acetylmuramoyl-tripeptide--D-alanyl-D-alanine ligase [Virgibacillus ainsalahensis]